MEGIRKQTVITDDKLKRLFRLYGIAAAVFMVILAGCVLMKEYTMSYDETASNLEKIRLGLVRTERATRDMEQSIAKMEQVIPAHLLAESPEKQILTGLDSLKGIIENTTINVTDMAKKEGRVTLPVSIKGVITDYSHFVNKVGYLQAMRFPFMVIQGISIRKEDLSPDAGGQKKPRPVVFEITGELVALSASDAGRPKTDAEPQGRRFLSKEGS